MVFDNFLKNIVNISDKDILHLSQRKCLDYKIWRKKVFIRDNFTCKCCGSKKRLNAHHKLSYKIYNTLRFDVDNGITLCERCHSKFHGKYGLVHFPLIEDIEEFKKGYWEND